MISHRQIKIAITQNSVEFTCWLYILFQISCFTLSVVLFLSCCFFVLKKNKALKLNPSQFLISISVTEMMRYSEIPRDLSSDSLRCIEVKIMYTLLIIIKIMYIIVYINIINLLFRFQKKT